VDESIIGGVKLRVGDRIADASVRHKFDQLRMRLEKSTAMVEVSVEASS
jgi:F0F1-type ATP synthase delta subunit